MVALSPAVRAFLEEPRFGVLATVNADGSPQQTVMWFELRDDYILMNTKRNRQKERTFLRDARCSLLVEDGYTYVAIMGSVTLVEDPAQAQRDIAALAYRYKSKDEADEMIRTGFSREERISIHLPLEKLDVHGLDG